jgi:glycosyltransferase involved in cell wall biosynthesis
VTVSVLILTKNEERDLPDCLRSVRWADDVHVLDSGSTDRTIEIATASAAVVTSRRYDPRLGPFGGNEAEHRNWALRNLPFRHPWVLQLDADERVTPELAGSVVAAVRAPGGRVAFRLRRRDIFLDTWLRHVQASAWYIRLFRPARMRFERLINPVSIADGPVGELQGYLDHHPFSKGMAHWLARHNSYSTLEAQQIVGNRARGERYRIASALFEADFHRRRFHQKELFYRLPARPLLKFLLLYFAKLGFLDGRAGFTYAALQSIYEYFIVLKTRELTRAADQ